jgi:uncharacterized membrane protein
MSPSCNRSAVLRNLFTSFFITLTIVCGTLPAHARSWRITHFDAAITIDKGGHALVTEKIGLRFEGAYHGIHRRIPIHYPGPSGTSFTLFLDVLNVNDEETHQPLRFEDHRQGDYRELTIYIPGAEDASKKVEIAYKVVNPIRHFADYDEFYWNVTGSDWPVPIDASSASIYFPENANGLRAQAFTGVYGSHHSDAIVSVNGTRVDVESSNPLPMRGGMTVDVYIPQGILNQPSSLGLAAAFVRSNPVVLMPLLGLLIMWLLWWFIGRDPDAGLSVAPQYGPPEKMTPAEAGMLIDDSVDARDITSTIVDLAVRGYIRIEEIEEKGLIFTSKDYKLHLLKPRAEWGELTDFEEVMLKTIFVAEDKTRRISDLKNHFYTAIPSIKSGILTGLKAKGMYRVDPNSANAYWLLGAGATVFAAWLLCKAIGVGLLDSGILSFACIGVTILIVFLIGRQMTAKSLAGARAWVHVKGFQEFMNRVEADKLRTLPPDTFEKFLPYAMALGVEAHWVKAFAGIIQNPPSWYTGPSYTTFNTMSFGHSLSSMSTAAHEAFVSAPRASSSGSGFSSGGGFGGGGFSGGGFGGGGGDAF